MENAPDKTRFQELLEENEALKQKIKSFERTQWIWKGLKYRVGRKAGYFFLGKGLRKSFYQLYTELPDRVSKETFADITAHLIWRVTRIGLFAVLVSIIPLMILFVQTLILRQQNKLSAQQNDLFELQIQQLNRQNDLISGQNDLFKEQNLLFLNQNENVEKQNTLVDGQNKLVGNQNDLFGNQNQLVSAQNRRIEQQTELIEADRRSSLVFLMSNIMDKVDEELKSEKNETRTLSYELIGRISALSQSLKPYRYLQNDQLIERPLSPERGQLLLSLANSQLDQTTTLPTIFRNANFNFADMGEAVLEKAFMAGAKMNYASLQNALLTEANLTDIHLAEADLRDATMVAAVLAEADLRHARLQQADLRNVDFTGASMMEAIFDEADMTEAVLLGAYLDKASFKDTDLTDAVLIACNLRGADLSGTILDGALVSSPRWFDQLQAWNVRGWKALRQAYQLIEDPEEGFWRLEAVE